MYDPTPITRDPFGFAISDAEFQDWLEARDAERTEADQAALDKWVEDNALLNSDLELLEAPW
jgi:hypothetical protein